MDLVNIGEFEPRTVDKVERLLGLLEELERHPGLKGKLALHRSRPWKSQSPMLMRSSRTGSSPAPKGNGNTCAASLVGITVPDSSSQTPPWLTRHP